MSEKTVILNIAGMSCGSCVGKIENAFKGLKGVEKVSVDLANKKAKVKFNTEDIPSNQELINTVKNVGFTASIAV